MTLTARSPSLAASAIAAAFALFTPITDGHAQTSSADDRASIDEITVTARKIEEIGQQVPVAFDVLDAEEMRRQGFDTISDTALLVPGVTYDMGGFVQDTRPAMRGMQNERGRPSVAIMIAETSTFMTRPALKAVLANALTAMIG